MPYPRCGVSHDQIVLDRSILHLTITHDFTLIDIRYIGRTNAEMANSAVGVSPQNGAPAATLFQSNSAGVRVFSNHRPAPAGLTESAPPGDDLETAAAEPVRPLTWAEDGDSDSSRFSQVRGVSHRRVKTGDFGAPDDSRSSHSPAWNESPDGGSRHMRTLL